jgi:hypothetical protein
MGKGVESMRCDGRGAPVKDETRVMSWLRFAILGQTYRRNAADATADQELNSVGQ